MDIFLINSVIYLIAISGCLIIGGLIINDVPVNAPPGFSTRVVTYLTTNVAETRRNHPFPELELRCYTLPIAALFSRVEHAILVLGWEVLEVDAERYRLRVVVVTPLLKFKDDVEIQLVATPSGTELHVRSASRVGKGDLGANTRHILNLFEALAHQA